MNVLYSYVKGSGWIPEHRDNEYFTFSEYLELKNPNRWYCRNCTNPVGHHRVGSLGLLECRESRGGRVTGTYCIAYESNE